MTKKMEEERERERERWVHLGNVIRRVVRAGFSGTDHSSQDCGPCFEILIIVGLHLD